MRFLLAIAFCLLATVASAQIINLQIINGSAPSTAFSCPLGSYTAPLAPGSLICNITMTPSTWQGALYLTGPDAASFALSGLSLVVGPATLAAGNYTLTVTSTP